MAELSDGEFTGRGEAAGVCYLGDDSEHIVAELEEYRDPIETFLIARTAPADARWGARNAVDCALWDLEAKREAGAGASPRRHR